MIRRDKIDILVDLSQHLARNRLQVFARQPSPVQVSFAGYPASTGLEAISYRISDRYLESEIEDRRSEIGCGLPSSDAEPRSAERVFLVDSFWCYRSCPGELEINALPATANGYVTFGSLNAFCKINEPVLRLWGRVLSEVRDSRLVLLAPEGSHTERARAILREAGVAPDRLEFLDLRPRSEYLALYRRVDIVLDPFPYNGHTTGLDALWMGVPVVTLGGEASVSRAGLSEVSNLAVPELAAFSVDGYLRLAADLARDLPPLAQLRAILRPRMEASLLMDAARFARQIETAYRSMWRRWCAAKLAAPPPTG
jgi:predicted O-linked N-acetylglucosamine transferase (SPINDLY family)